MKIGFLFDASGNDGGVFQYSNFFFDTLLEINKYKKVIFTPFPEKFKDLNKKNDLKFVKIPDINFDRKKNQTSSHLNNFAFNNFQLIYKLIYRHDYFDLIGIINRKQNANLIRIINSQKLDLMIFPTPTNASLYINAPFITAIHDLQHKIEPQFPEVSLNGVWESRERSYKLLCKKAKVILAESIVGKEDILNCYNIGPERVVILPYLPPSDLDPEISIKHALEEAKKLGLPAKYVYYPAKFWPHKNHLNLIKALNLLKREGKIINLVLTGSKDAEFSTYYEVVKLVKRYNLERQILYLGYVGNKQISAIYKLSTTLVMPTFFGPTNIPVLEAWKMGTPVIYSDIRGCREQLGDAGLLINPKSPKDIADKILKIYTQPKLARELVRRGRIRLNKWTFKDFSKKIGEIVENYEEEKSITAKNNKEG